MVVLCWAFLLVDVSFGQAGPGPGSEIDNLIGPQADGELFSGAVLVAAGDEVIHEGFYGYANFEHRVPNDSGTRFAVGSISKSFTAKIAHALVESGDLDTGAPVERYLPQFPRGPGGDIATIEHLLSHTSGVPHRVTTPIEESQYISARDIVGRIGKVGLAFDPGRERLYSSAGYTALSAALESASGQTFADLLQRHVFDPAGMQSAMDETDGRLMPGRALSYRLGVVDGELAVKSSPSRNLGFLKGAGSVFATAEDLFHYARAVKAGVYGEAAQAELDGDADSWQGYYGRTNSYEASVDYHSGNDLTIVVLSNLQSISTSQVRTGIRRILLEGVSDPIPLPPRPVAPFEMAEDISGSYGRAVITARGTELYRGENEFYAMTGDAYYIPASGTTMTFRRNEDGVVTGLVSTSAGGRVSELPRTD